MIGYITCWVIALNMLFSKVSGFTDDYKRMLFAMGVYISRHIVQGRRCLS